MRTKILRMQIVLYLSGAILAIIVAVIFFPLVLHRDELSDHNIAIQNITPASSSHSLAPIVSNQWFSSIFVDFPSQPIYTLPIAFKITPSGLGFSYPSVQKTSNTIIAPYQQDFTVGYSESLNKPKITSIGDWTIGISQTTDENESISYVLGHGLPFTSIKMTGKTGIISFSNAYIFYDNNSKSLAKTTLQTRSFVVETNNHFYIYVLPQNGKITLTDKAISISNPQQLFVGLLDKRENYNLFENVSNVTVLDTKASPTLADNKLITTFQITTNGPSPLIALYPHQYDNLSNQQHVLGSYQTIRGTLQLIQASSFATRIPLEVPDTGYTKLTSDYPDLTLQIKKDISNLITEGPPNSKDYYLGKWFGKIDNLLLLSDAYGLETEKHKLLSYAEPLFLQSLDDFSYDKVKSSLIAKYPEFGNENLNDHHFHYGYYIRTGAVLSSFDLSFLPKIQDKIGNMVDDIATLEPDSIHYPYIRNFDAYESHSWADGYADFSDGNDEESSSEAINAWYSLYLWSKIINDANLEKFSLYLYNSEILGTKYYWFDNANIYGLPYQHALSSMVWGDKVTFSTWFSDKTNMKYGIELLPFTPASAYLAELSGFKKYLSDFSSSGGDQTDDWGDLFIMWQSFYDPKSALLFKDRIKKFEEGSSKSVFLYTIYANLETKAARLSLPGQ